MTTSRPAHPWHRCPRCGVCVRVLRGSTVSHACPKFRMRAVTFVEVKEES